MAQGRATIRGQGYPGAGDAAPYATPGGAGRSELQQTPQGTPLSQGAPTQGTINALNISPSLYGNISEKIKTQNGIIDVTFSPVNTSKGLVYSPTKINQNVTFTQPINTSENGFNLNGIAKYTYQINNGQIQANVINQSGALSYQAPGTSQQTVIGNIGANGNISLLPNATVAVPITGSIGNQQNQFLGTVFYTPTITNGNVNLNYSSFQGTNINITGSIPVTNPNTGQQANITGKIGYTISATTTFNPSTNTIGLNLPNYGGGNVLPNISTNIYAQPQAFYVPTFGITIPASSGVKGTYNLTFNPITGIGTTTSIAAQQGTLQSGITFPGAGTYTFYAGNPISGFGKVQQGFPSVNPQVSFGGGTPNVFYTGFLAGFFGPAVFQSELAKLQASGGGYYTYTLVNGAQSKPLVIPASLLPSPNTFLLPSPNTLTQSFFLMPSTNISGLKSLSTTTVTNNNVVFGTINRTLPGTITLKGMGTTYLAGSTTILNTNPFIKQPVPKESTSISYSILGFPSVPSQGSNPIANIFYSVTSVLNINVNGATINPFGTSTVAFTVQKNQGIFTSTSTIYENLMPSQIPGQQAILTAEYSQTKTPIQLATQIGAGIGTVGYGLYSPFATTGQFETASAVVLGSGLFVVAPEAIGAASGIETGTFGIFASALLRAPFGGLANVGFSEATSVISRNGFLTPAQETTAFEQGAVFTFASSYLGDVFLKPSLTFNKYQFIQATTDERSGLISINAGGKTVFTSTQPDEITDFLKASSSVGQGQLEKFTYDLRTQGSASLITIKGTYYGNIVYETLGKGKSVVFQGEGLAINAAGESVIGGQIPSISGGEFKFNLYTESPSGELTLEASNIGVSQFSQSLSSQATSVQAETEGIKIPGTEASTVSGTATSGAGGFSINLNVNQNILGQTQGSQAIALNANPTLALGPGGNVDINTLFATMRNEGANLGYGLNAADASFLRPPTIIDESTTFGGGGTISNGLADIIKPTQGTLSYTSGTNQGVSFALSEEVQYPYMQNIIERAIFNAGGSSQNLPDLFLQSQGDLSQGIPTGRNIFEITSQGEDTFSAITFSYQTSATYYESAGFENEAGSFKITSPTELQGYRTIGKAYINTQKEPIEIEGFSYQAINKATVGATSTSSSTGFNINLKALGSWQGALGTGQGDLALGSGQGILALGTGGGTLGDGIDISGLGEGAKPTIGIKGLGSANTGEFTAIEGKNGMFTLMKPTSTVTTEITETSEQGTSILEPTNTGGYQKGGYVNEPFFGESSETGMSGVAQSKFLERISGQGKDFIGAPIVIPKVGTVGTYLGITSFSALAGIVGSGQANMFQTKSLIINAQGQKQAQIQSNKQFNIGKLAQSQAGIFKQSNRLGNPQTNAQTQGNADIFKVPNVQKQPTANKQVQITPFKLTVPTVNQEVSVRPQPIVPPGFGFGPTGGGGILNPFGGRKPKKQIINRPSPKTNYIFGTTPDLTHSTLNIHGSNKSLTARLRKIGVSRPL